MQIKHLLRYPINITRAKRLLEDRSLAPMDHQPIVLDLHTSAMLLDCGRHFACLAHYGSIIGSPLILRCSRYLLAAIAHKPLGREMLSMNHVSWLGTAERLPDNALVLSDVSRGDGCHTLPSQRVIEMQIGCEILDSCPVMPYPMHPDIINLATRDSLTELRQTSKRQGVLFAGSTRARYRNSHMEKRFGVMNRLAILDTLTEECSDKSSIMLRDDSLPRIAVDQWLPELAQHQFFLCCPGAAQPMCHNLIESMAVGTIPVIEYGDRVSPALTDEVNAICFQGRQGLVDAINRIEKLTNDQIRKMSDSAAHFYDQHLRGDDFLRDLRDGRLDVSSGQICLPFHGENLFAQQQVAAA